MNFIGKLFLWMGLAMFSLLVISVGFSMSADKSVDFSVKEATKQAMYQGISKGCLRVDENIVLDEEVTKEALVRSFSNLSRYDQGKVDLFIHEFSSYPPMLSTEAYHTINTPFKEWLNVWDRGKRDSENTVRELELAIFEAKSLTKPITAEDPTNIGSQNPVDNFQCY